MELTAEGKKIGLLGRPTIALLYQQKDAFSLYPNSEIILKTAANLTF